MENVCRGNTGKKRVKDGNNEETEIRPLRSYYTDFFKSFQILPSELAKQSPKVLFKMLDGLEDEEDEAFEVSNPMLRAFYGL